MIVFSHDLGTHHRHTVVRPIAKQNSETATPLFSECLPQYSHDAQDTKPVPRLLATALADTVCLQSIVSRNRIVREEIDHLTSYIVVALLRPPFTALPLLPEEPSRENAPSTGSSTKVLRPASAWNMPVCRRVAVERMP